MGHLIVRRTYVEKEVVRERAGLSGWNKRVGPSPARRPQEELRQPGAQEKGTAMKGREGEPAGARGTTE